MSKFWWKITNAFRGEIDDLLWPWRWNDGHFKYLYTMFVLGFVVPLCIISFCYGMIIIKVRKSEKNAKKNVFKTKASSSLGNTRPSRSRIIVINRIARLLTNALAEPLARYGFKKDAEKVQVGLPTNNSRESNARRQLNTFVASILSTFVVCRLPWYIWHIIKVKIWPITYD